MPRLETTSTHYIKLGQSGESEAQAIGEGDFGTWASDVAFEAAQVNDIVSKHASGTAPTVKHEAFA